MSLLKKYPNGVLSGGFVFTTGEPKNDSNLDGFVLVSVNRPGNGSHVANVAVCCDDSGNGDSARDESVKAWLATGAYPLVADVDLKAGKVLQAFAFPKGVKSPDISVGEYEELRKAFHVFAKEHLFPNAS